MISKRLMMTTSIAASLLLGAASEALSQNVTVDLNTQRQIIRGFGGMNHKIWNGYDLNTSDRNLAFGNGDGQIGMTILRIWVSDKPSDWAVEVPTAKDVISRGGVVFATPWNPPGGGNNSTKTAGTWRELYTTDRWRILPSKYNDYAKHLNDFVAYMKTNGVTLNSVSIQNEPDWDVDWTGGTATDMYNLAKTVCPQITGTKCMSAESFSFQKSYYDQILNDPAVLKSVGIFGTHFYGTQASAMPYALYQSKGVPAGKEFWMTEVYTDSKNDADLWPMALDVGTNIHNTLVEGQLNAYVWWSIRRDYSPIKNSTGKVSKRGYLMAQYAKFVRPGAYRVEATKAPAAGLLVSAYKNADGKPVIVVVNQNTSAKTLNISVPAGTTVKTYQKYTTSESKNVSNDGSVSTTNGAFSASLDAQSVTTFVGTPISVGIDGKVSDAPRPDPFLEGGLRIRLEENFEYRITDTKGSLVESGRGQGDVKVGSRLNPGMYLIGVQSRTGSFDRKILKN
jgi:glucuronoarabinoxylan endo-1,4-beta-xylanase